MHICFIGRGVHPPWVTGESALTKNLIECLKDKVELSLVTTINETVDPFNEEQFYRFARSLDGCFVSKSDGNYYHNSFLMWRGLTELMKKNEVTCIHPIGVSPVIFAPLYKMKMKHNLNSPKFIRHIIMPYFQVEDKFRFCVKPIRRAIYSRFIDNVVVTTPFTHQWLSNLGIISKIHVVPPPIDCTVFRPLRKKKSIDNDFCILYLGPLNPARFPAHEVLTAIKLLEESQLNVNLLIVARGLLKSDYESAKEIMSISKKLNVAPKVKILIKALNQEEKVELYNNCDLVIFPFKEPQTHAMDPPLVLLEAMSCGRIVLATRHQSFPQIIKDQVNGLLIDTPTPHAIARSIRGALTKEVLLRRNARETVLKEYSPEIVADKLLQVYSQVCDE